MNLFLNTALFYLITIFFFFFLGEIKYTCFWQFCEIHHFKIQPFAVQLGGGGGGGHRRFVCAIDAGQLKWELLYFMSETWLDGKVDYSQFDAQHSLRYIGY